MQRVFIGIPVDKKSQQLVNKSLLPVRKMSADIRWVPESDRHLTLAFLGNRPESEVADLLGVFDETYQQQPGFQYCLSLLTRFPDPAGRIIALTGLPGGPLEGLSNITRQLLKKYGIGFDRKAFRPHVTLARIQNQGQVKTELDQQTEIILDVRQVVLYQSTLSKSGKSYTRLKETTLAR